MVLNQPISKLNKHTFQICRQKMPDYSFTSLNTGYK